MKDIYANHVLNYTLRIIKTFGNVRSQKEKGQKLNGGENEE